MKNSIEEMLKDTGLEDTMEILSILNTYKRGKDISGSIAILCMAIETYATINDIDVLELYDNMRQNTQKVINEYGSMQDWSSYDGL